MKGNIYVSNLFSLLILALIVGGTGYYLYSTRPCAQPIYYSIGSYATQFGLSQTEFLADAQIAANLWNKEAGHTVLAYSDTGKMPLNLIYDNRQQQTNIGQTISQQEDALSAEKAQVANMQSQYDAMKQQYVADQSAGKDVATLNSEARSLNDLAAQIQSQVDSLNAKIDAVNSNANAYNTQAGTDFEEGDFVEQYGSSRIDLYEYKNNTQLIRLMAHEFGHSLGLAHNTNPDSIMYPENTGTTIALSAQDSAELQARCAVTLNNLNPFQNVSLSSP
jgi:predicted Zn-dependent protease